MPTTAAREKSAIKTQIKQNDIFALYVLKLINKAPLNYYYSFRYRSSNFMTNLLLLIHSFSKGFTNA